MLQEGSPRRQVARRDGAAADHDDAHDEVCTHEGLHTRMDHVGSALHGYGEGEGEGEG